MNALLLTLALMAPPERPDFESVAKVWDAPQRTDLQALRADLAESEARLDALIAEHAVKRPQHEQLQQATEQAQAATQQYLQGGLAGTPAGEQQGSSPVSPVLPADAQPTPYSDVGRALNLLAPKKSEAFVDFGCGSDARVVIAAARYYGCRCIGVEVDPRRAASARQAVRAAGVEHSVKVVEGDATTVDVDADVGFAFLFEDTLARLKPKIEKLDRFVSAFHKVPGLPMEKHGNLWLWKRPEPTLQYTQPTAVYGGRVYTGPCCNNPRCTMRKAIMAQLQQRARGRYVKICRNGVCSYQWIPQ